MTPMLRAFLAFTCLLASACPGIAQEESSYPSFGYENARTHELKPHRRTIPLKGIHQGFNQLHLTVIVSPLGDVIQADGPEDGDLSKFWPQVKPEVLQWKFLPFEENGKAVTAEVEEYVDLVPPERLPAKHVAAPILRPDSKISITLVRSGCYGSCPSYSVSIRSDRILFEGYGNVVAFGKHRATVRPEGVRALAKKFIAADFYSMDSSYRASVTDNPTYVLSISIDGHKKEVEDYVGSW